MTEQVRDRVFGFIDGAAELAVELETELCRRPAVSPDSGGEGEGDKCAFLEGWLRERGITRLERFDAPDPRAKGGARPNLAATLPGAEAGSAGAGRLWVISHLDVVPPGELSLWHSDPWQAVYNPGGKDAQGRELGPHIVGRGVEDNQQAIVSSALAALALLDAGALPARTVKLLFAADEENGSAFGVAWLLKHAPGLFRPADCALIPDGGDSRGASIEIAEKNLLWLKVRTSGAQAHGSRPDQGRNAFLAASDLAVRLHRGLAEKFPARDALFTPDRSTFEPTRKEANVPNINTIPGEDVFYMDMRILPRYPLSEALAQVARITAEVEAEYGVRVDCEPVQRVESRPTREDAPLVRLLAAKVAEVYGVTPRPIGIGGGTIAAWLRNAGIDSAVWSRLDGAAHEPNEHALLANILGDAKVIALLMLGEGEGGK
ncbi:MAG: M20 family metallo-hydrolase/succinyl-diaminopimelate desuccinylase [Treponematales bacterium]